MITWRPAALLGAGAAALVPAGLILGEGRWPWVAAAAILTAVAGLTAADIAAAVPPGSLTFRRAGETTVWLGETATVTLTVVNGSERVLRARIRDVWVPSAGASPDAHDLVLEAHRAAKLSTSLTPTRRGDRPAVAVAVRSYGPLGLGYRQSRAKTAAAVTPPWQLRVLPRFPSRKLLPEKVARLRTLDGSTSIRGRGMGSEFDSLREYVIGDDVRSVDWRASARRNDVLVRTWRPERDRRVVCVIDTGRTSAARTGDEPRLDASIDAALLLASLASRAGDRVDVLAIDTAVRASVTGASANRLPWQCVAALAPLRPALVETDFGLVAGEVLRLVRKRALVVLFTALEPGAIGEGLLPVLPKLAARHRVLVAAVHDPELDELATLDPREPQRAARVYLAASAQRTLAERDRVRSVLASNGVEIVDAAADRLAGAVCDAYLGMKAAGRL